MSMVEPSIDTLMENGKHNRYVVCLAAAKCAREITDEYTRQREAMEHVLAANKDNEKAILALMKKEYRDEKAVRNAINRMVDGEFVIVGDGSETPETLQASEQETE